MAWFLCPGTGAELRKALDVPEATVGLVLGWSLRERGGYSAFVTKPDGGFEVVQPGCGQRSSYGGLRRTLEVVEWKEERERVAVPGAVVVLPDPDGKAGLPGHPGYVLEHSGPGYARLPSVPGQLTLNALKYTGAMVKVPARRVHHLEFIPLGQGQRARSLPLGIWHDGQTVELGDGRLVSLPSSAVERSPLPTPEPARAPAPPPMYEAALRLLNERPNALVSVRGADQCKRVFVPERMEDGPLAWAGWVNSCRWAIRVDRVLFGDRALEGRMFFLRAASRPTRFTGPQVLGRVRRGYGRGREVWLQQEFADDEESIHLATALGRGLQPGARVPDVTPLIGRHAFSDAFAAAKNLAVIGPGAGVTRDLEGCVAELHVQVVHGFRGPLRTGEFVHARPIDARDEPLGEAIVAYRMEGRQVVLTHAWPVNAAAVLAAAMATHSAVPRWPYDGRLRWTRP